MNRVLQAVMADCLAIDCDVISLNADCWFNMPNGIREQAGRELDKKMCELMESYQKIDQFPLRARKVQPVPAGNIVQWKGEIFYKVLCEIRL